MAEIPVTPKEKVHLITPKRLREKHLSKSQQKEKGICWDNQVSSGLSRAKIAVNQREEANKQNCPYFYSQEERETSCG